MDTRRTLIVRHLPAELSMEDQADLLKHFGATSVRCMGSRGRLKHAAFATFADGDQAKSALTRLHQLEILDSILVVELAKKQHESFHSAATDFIKPKVDDKPKAGTEKVALKVDTRKVTNNINNTTSQWGFEYRVNPRLQYIYPSPTVNILTNIANALATVPRFYVQVLHLMNKMNLPAPFGPVTSTPPLPLGEPATEELPPEPDTLEVEEMDMSSTEESELSSEDDQVTKMPLQFPAKRAARKPDKTDRKHKLQKIISAPKLKSRTSQRPEDIFEQPESALQKKIEFNLSTISENLLNVSTSELCSTIETNAPAPSDMLVITTDQAAESGGFGKIDPIKKGDTDLNEEEGEEEEEWGTGEFISSRRLRRSRISSSEMKHLNIFRNYKPGEPTSRLYIKNLAKHTTDKDLHYIFGRYVDWSDEMAKVMFDIRLMKEGRMKGQAFITLPEEVKAKEALKDTNGFVLHDKPMVVQFALSAKPKEKPSGTAKK